jgi:hypothetical protein
MPDYGAGGRVKGGRRPVRRTAKRPLTRAAERRGICRPAATTAGPRPVQGPGRGAKGEAVPSCELSRRSRTA